MAHYPIPEILRRISVIRVFRNVALVAIDGPSGAGKSTLARELSEAGDQTAVVSGDDFYRPASDDERRGWSAEEGARKYFDWERLELEVLGPLSRTGRCRYQRYDWPSGKLSEPIQLPNAHVVLVEGVYSFRPELRRYYDFSIMVTTPRAERLRRWKQRGDPEEWVLRWDASEELYFESTHPEEAAEMVVAGSSEIAP
jgi:uridine kinase